MVNLNLGLILRQKTLRLEVTPSELATRSSIPLFVACLKDCVAHCFNLIIWGLEVQVLEQNNLNILNLGPIYADVYLHDLQV